MKLSNSLLLIFIFSFAGFAQQNHGKAVAANFNAVATNGVAFELEALKGKVVVLTFWSTRCPICHSEIPKLNKLAESYKDKDVVFLAPTMNNADSVNAYVQKNPFNFNLLPDSFGVVMKYADSNGSGKIAMGFPAHFVINQAGEIELKTSGFDKTEQLNSEINRLLKSSKSAEE